MGNALSDQPIRCAPEELANVIPPAGQTCDQFLANFSTTLDNPNPSGVGYFETLSNGQCAFCQYREGEDYLSGIELNGAYRFRDIGIICGYIAFNFLLCFALFYMFRIFSFKKSPTASASKKSKKAAKAVKAKNSLADAELGAAVPFPRGADGTAQNAGVEKNAIDTEARAAEAEAVSAAHKEKS